MSSHEPSARTVSDARYWYKSHSGRCSTVSIKESASFCRLQNSQYTRLNSGANSMNNLAYSDTASSQSGLLARSISVRSELDGARCLQDTMSVSRELMLRCSLSRAGPFRTTVLRREDESAKYGTPGKSLKNTLMSTSKSLT